MEWMIMPLKRYVDFQGRSRRKEYWMYILLVLIALIVAVALELSLGLGTAETTAYDDGFGGSAGYEGGPLMWIVLLATFLPTLAVQVRRFHDQDKSGWFVLLGLIPFVGGIIMIVFMCTEGTRGPNRFGPDPKSDGGEDAHVFE